MLKQKHIVLTIALLIILVPLGFYTKIYTGYGHEWVHNKLGGVFYELFWCLVFYVLLPKSKPFGIAMWVFIITSILEFIQLLNNNFLDILRSNFIGQTIIGNSFSWSDFPYYAIGCLIGYIIMSGLNKLK